MVDTLKSWIDDMIDYRKYRFPFSDWDSHRYQLGFLITALLAIYVVSGCNFESSKQSFVRFGSSGGLSLEKPSNWHAEFNDRNETIVLSAERGISSKDSVRIVIQPFTTLAKTAISSEHLEAAIEIISTRYDLESVTVIKEPTKIEDEKYDMATAVILIPTKSIPEDSTANQVGVQSPDIFQTVELYALKCSNNFAIVYVYKGNNEQLNIEAEDVVESIELTCSTEP